ncbi:beta-ketoacyl-ACP synthase III [Amycolatopsis japonica]|uniref:beta-ketoacyl-ACP synthase III n=1 Tax=Amycolatopsis japonica TaxID=208439 RepID=UPI003829B405
MTAAVLTGLGSALPTRLVTNEELSTRLDTTDEWIRTRTGIGQRFWSDGESTGDLAVAAGERALAAARVSEADMVVLATTTPDHPCPATAPEVASRLGLGHAAAFDIGAVCSGFVYALAMASAGISAGLADRALVIGAETYSTILDPEDRTTSVIFGDGAGAVVLERGEKGAPGSFAGFDLGSDGANRDLIQVPGGGSRERTGADGMEGRYFTMRGKAVFKEAVTRMAGSASKLLDSVGWAKDSVDLLVGHQANTRILHALADHLSMPRERVVIDLDRVGNTSAASIPLALARAATENRLRPGDRVLLSAFGGGLTWGSTALVWPELSTGIH